LPAPASIVSEPEPASIVSLPVPAVIASLPAPAITLLLPLPAVITSLSAPESIVSLPLPAVITSSPAPEDKLSPIESAFDRIESAPEPETTESCPVPVSIVSGPVPVEIESLPAPNDAVTVEAPSPDAVMMSSALPILITPIIIENKCYMDGGVSSNYPLKYCINSGKNEDEILGLCNQYDSQQKNHVDSNSNLLDFVLCFFFKMFNNLSSNNINPKIKYEVICNVKYISLNYLTSTVGSIEARKELYQKGTESAKEFIKFLENFESK
jgi:predicted acylesterase/phospholipase RssA